MVGHLLEHETPFKLLCLSDVARGLYEGCELVVGDGVLVDAVPPGTPANLAVTPQQWREQVHHAERTTLSSDRLWH